MTSTGRARHAPRPGSPHSDLPRDELIRGGDGDIGYLQYGTFLGDNQTFAMFLGPPSWDQDFGPLRHDEIREAAGRSIRAIEPWLDPKHSVALTDIQPMASHENVLRHFVEAGAGDWP